VILNVFISIADVAALALLLLVINFYISNSVDRLDFLPSWMLDPGSVALIGFFFILFGIKNLFGILISSAQFKFISRVAVRISGNKLANYQQGTFEDFVNVDSSSHISKIAYHPFEFSQHILSGIQQILIQSILILVTIAAILLYNAKLFLFLLLILVPPVTFVFFYIKKRLTSTKKNILEYNERSHKYLFDALKGYVEGNIYQRNDFFSERFAIARQQFSKYVFTSLSVQSMPGRIIETFAVLGLFILIVIVKWTGVNDSSTLITIGAFMASAYKIIPGIVKIINETTQMKAYDFSIYDLYNGNNKNEADNFTRSDPIKSLELKNVSFKYKDQSILRNLSFCINCRDFVGISGRSGRGKTTVVNLLLGFLTPDKGNILINGNEVSPSEIKKHWPVISYVRQQPFLIHDTILKNITLNEKQPDTPTLDQALKYSGLKDFLTDFPEGVNKLITENGKNISGGQQQRVAIARAIYKNADIVFLDEPFNELDETSAISLVKYFKDLASSGKIVVMITHDSTSLSYCNKIISLDEQ